MPKDPSQLFINTNQDPGLVVGSGSATSAANLHYPTEQTTSTGTIVNIIQYNLNTIGANNEVLINQNNVATGDAELTYDANTNILHVETLYVGNISALFSTNLGNVANLKITGGVDGYVLKTDGYGNLSWTSQQVANVSWNSLTGKPTFATVAVSGSYNDLTNKPANIASTTYVDNLFANITYANLSGAPELATVATSGRYNDLTNLPELSAVALSGDYNDLANLPSIPDITGLASTTYVDDQIANVSWGNLVGRPTIPTHTSNLINNSDYITSSALSDYALTTDIPTDIANLSDVTNLLSTGIDTGNITFTGDEIGSTNSVVNIRGDNYAELQSNDSYIWVEANNADIEVNGYQWVFDSDGNLTLPGKILAMQGSGTNGGYSFSGDEGGNDTGMFSQNDGVLDFYSNNEKIVSITTDSVDFSRSITSNGLEVYTNAGSGSDIDLYTDWSNGGVEVWLQHNDRVLVATSDGQYQWSFDNSGNLIFPDNTVQTTAYTGPINIFDQDLNTTNDVTFSSVSTQTISFNSGASISEQSGDPGRADIVIDSESNVNIKTNESMYVWNFGNDGNLTFPDGTIQPTAANFVGYATETYVGNAIGNLINGAPNALNTLSELANALGNNANYASAITNQLANKANISDIPNLTPYATITYVNNKATWGNIASKPSFATVATSGDYNDLTNQPTIPDGTYANLTGKPNLATVATSGSYNDLINKPSLFSGSYLDLSNKPSLFSGSYLDLSDTPYIPTNTSDLTNDSGFLTSETQSDWNETATESPAYIWNKPSIQTFDQDLNTTNDVTFSSVTSGNIFNTNTIEITTPYGTAADIDIYTDWSGSGLTGGIDLWLKHGDGLYVKTHDNTHIWSFGDDGVFTVPGSIQTNTGADLYISAPSAGNPGNWGSLNLSWGSNDNNAHMYLNKYGINLGTSQNVAIGAGTKSWTFDSAGKIKLPAGGDIVDSTGTSVLGVSGNPFDQDLNTSNNVSFVSVKTGGDLNYTDSANLISVEDKDGFGQVLFQNKNSGANASMNIVLVNDSQGTDYMAIGINSSTFSPLYNTLFELPNAGYISHTVDTVIGPQSDHSSSSRVYLTYNSGSNALELNEHGAIGWGASYNGTLTEGDFGTSGQVLTSSGPSSAPTWTTITGSNTANVKFGDSTLYTINGSDIRINPSNDGSAYINIPNFQDGGEVLTITNQYYYNNGIDIVTEGNNTFKFKGTDLTLPPGGDIKDSTGISVLGGGTSKAEPSFDIKTTNFNALSGSRYGINTSTSTVTATLPATPTAGDAIYFVDAGGEYATNNLTVNPNGGSIMGLPENMTVSVNNQNFGLMYNGTTWRVY